MFNPNPATKVQSPAYGLDIAGKMFLLLLWLKHTGNFLP